MLYYLYMTCLLSIFDPKYISVTYEVMGIYHIKHQPFNFNLYFPTIIFNV